MVHGRKFVYFPVIRGTLLNYGQYVTVVSTPFVVSTFSLMCVSAAVFTLLVDYNVDTRHPVVA